MPKRKVISTERAAKEVPKRSTRLLANLLLQKWKRGQKRQQERINLRTKKCRQKTKGEPREKRPKPLIKKPRKIYLQKMEKLMRRARPLTEQKIKAKSD